MQIENFINLAFKDFFESAYHGGKRGIQVVNKKWRQTSDTEGLPLEAGNWKQYVFKRKHHFAD